jgi:ATP-dependent Clp protease ATP-binding subunit ClpC
MNDKFTERVRKVIYLARDEANRLQHDYIGTEHLLLGIVREGEGIAARVLQKLDLDLDQIQQAIENMVKPSGGTLTLGEIPLTPRAKRVLELSVEEARLLGHNYVGTEHLLLGLIREGEGVAARVLLELGVDRKRVREEIMKILHQGGGGVGARKVQRDKSETPTLDQFGRDLTRLAQDNKLDPIIGRDREISRVIQILCRRKKNNPVLIGEPGVGKTAIIEGLGQRIVENKVPELLRDRRITTLDLASIVAGTKYRGQFEERLKTIINEIRDNEQVIIFIDEVHTIVGAGGAEGAIDASNMLKPALARGEIQCIGATTLDEYRKHIEKDGALERRFQQRSSPTRRSTRPCSYRRDIYRGGSCPTRRSTPSTKPAPGRGSRSRRFPRNCASSRSTSRRSPRKRNPQFRRRSSRRPRRSAIRKRSSGESSRRCIASGASRVRSENRR